MRWRYRQDKESSRAEGSLPSSSSSPPVSSSEPKSTRRPDCDDCEEGFRDMNIATEDDDDDDEEEKETELQKLTVEKLKHKLKERGLKVSGKKQELIERLLGREVPKTKKVEWKKSKAKMLLQQMLLDKESQIHGKAVEEIYASHEWFQAYPLDKFEKYFEALRSTLERHTGVVEEDNRLIKAEIMKFPRKEKTCRGRHWWDTHAAAAKLKEDIKEGKHVTSKPKELWLSREEYQDFELSVFRRHIYQEKRRQKELPLRIARRNKDAAKKHQAEVDANKRAWESSYLDDEVQNICGEDQE